MPCIVQHHRALLEVGHFLFMSQKYFKIYLEPAVVTNHAAGKKKVTNVGIEHKMRFGVEAKTTLSVNQTIEPKIKKQRRFDVLVGRKRNRKRRMERGKGEGGILRHSPC